MCLGLDNVTGLTKQCIAYGATLNLPVDKEHF